MKVLVRKNSIEQYSTLPTVEIEAKYFTCQNISPENLTEKLKWSSFNSLILRKGQVGTQWNAGQTEFTS